MIFSQITRDSEYRRIVTDFTQRAKTDQSLKGIKGLYGKDPRRAERIADDIIKSFSFLMGPRSG